MPRPKRKAAARKTVAEKPAKLGKLTEPEQVESIVTVELEKVAEPEMPTEPEKPAEPEKPTELEAPAELVKPTEPEKSAEQEEQVDLDRDNDPEEGMKEEVEYDEVEVEEEEEEEEEEEDEEEEDAAGSDEEMNDGKDGDSRKRAELLALPPHGSEVYVGGIPLDTSKEELKSFCESIGEVTEVRVMKSKDSSESKRYAFVTYRTKELAAKAIQDLDNTKFKDKNIKCSGSQSKHRLFLGNIPRSWEKEDLEKVVTKIGPGVNVVELVKDSQTASRNRGFGFVEYYNHDCAEYSRQKMSDPKFKLGDNAPTVSWADRKSSDSSSSGSSQVKSVYVKNLPKNVTRDQLNDLFKRHGEIIKVVLPAAKAGQEKYRFGFVHFAERSSAMKALKDTEKYEIDGQILDCSLAKPQNEGKANNKSNPQKSVLLPTYPPSIGYGMIGSPYGSLAAAGYGSPGFGHPMMYGRGLSSASMPMMPMLLPDGRIGYVVGQPSAHLHTPPPQLRGNGRTGSGLSGRWQGSDSSRDRRYRPY